MRLSALLTNVEQKKPLRKREQERGNEERRWRRWILPLLVILVVIIAAILILWRFTQTPTPAAYRTCPSDCFTIDPPFVAPDGHGGIWVSVNVTFTYEGFYALQNATCTNLTLDFTYSADGGGFYTEHFTVNINGDVEPDIDYVWVPRWHFSGPGFPTQLQVTKCLCNG